jgi:hypothetical protein
MTANFVIGFVIGIPIGGMAGFLFAAICCMAKDGSEA